LRSGSASTRATSNYETGERRLDVVEFIAVAEAIAVDPETIIKDVRTT
jgi:hypothetical protein